MLELFTLEPYKKWISSENITNVKQPDQHMLSMDPTWLLFISNPSHYSARLNISLRLLPDLRNTLRALAR